MEKKEMVVERSGCTLAGTVMEDLSDAVAFEQVTESMKEQPCKTWRINKCQGLWTDKISEQALSSHEKKSNTQNQKTPDPDAFTGEFFQIFKEENPNNLQIKY